ncbi:MAG TPA: glycosyltransferase [Candidatus Paceibacterota bacterium]|nr:glycosyltransferase [Candidatus Paceibacterota bacterium]
MEKYPLVSVIVTLYNYENFISYCIKSILNQNYPNFEIIVVDDASSDNSYEIAKKYESKNVKVVKFKKNMGYSAAKNEGIRLSRGEYIVMLDADDMLTKKSISTRMKAMVDNDVDFIHANAIVVSGEMSLKSCYRIRDPKLECFSTPYHIHAQTVLLKKQIYRDFGLYDEKLRSRSDREMWWRLFGQSEEDEVKVKRIYIDKSVVYYRYHRKMMTRFRQKNREYDRKIRALSEEVYQVRKKMGITKENTLFLEDKGNNDY